MKGARKIKDLTKGTTKVCDKCGKKVVSPKAQNGTKHSKCGGTWIEEG